MRGPAPPAPCCWPDSAVSAAPRPGRSVSPRRSPRTATAAVAAADAHYSAAIALAGELGMRPLVAHCHLGLGKLHRRTGDAAKSQEHLTAASAMYREMAMQFWLTRAEAVLGLPS